MEKCEIFLKAEITTRKKRYVASCPLLDVHSQGSSEAEALARLAEAAECFLISCHEAGTLNDVLAECGFSLADGGLNQAESGCVKIALPFPLNTGRS